MLLARHRAPLTATLSLSTVSGVGKSFSRFIAREGKREPSGYRNSTLTWRVVFRFFFFAFCTLVGITESPFQPRTFSSERTAWTKWTLYSQLWCWPCLVSKWRPRRRTTSAVASPTWPNPSFRPLRYVCSGFDHPIFSLKGRRRGTC